MARKNREDENENAATEDAAQGEGFTQAFPEGREITLQGFKIFLPNRFQPGHVCSYNDALFLSSFYQSAAMNAFGDKAKMLKDGVRVKDEAGNDTNEWEISPISAEEMQAQAAEYFAAYTWTPRGAAEVQDPVEREMARIATSEMEAILRAQGKKRRGVDPALWEDTKAKYIGKHESRLREKAEANLREAQTHVSDDLLSVLG